MTDHYAAGAGASYTAQVAVEAASYGFDTLFSYLIPAGMLPYVQCGCRVVVPFGRSNKRVQGLVFSLSPLKEREQGLKSVLSVLDEEPVINEEMFSIISYLKEHTFCTWYDAVRTVLPLGMSVDIKQSYTVCTDLKTLDFKRFSPMEQTLLRLLAKSNHEGQINALLDYASIPENKKIVLSLIDKGIIRREDIFKKRVKEKTVRLLRLTERALDEGISFTAKQKPVIAFLRQAGFASSKEVCYYCGVSDSVIKGLTAKGYIEAYEQPVKEEPVKKWSLSSPKDIVLSEAQRQVADGILSLVQSGAPQAALLYGVTGSGKTQVYIKLIDAVLESGKQAMMLVPEIALTPQMVSGFEELFGDQVAVMHSGLSVSERMRQWKRIQRGDAKIVIGTRSAVFSPCARLGIIILDEEGEGSYKSDAAPRYHARDIAALRCATHRCLLLLGSATPSIESFYRAEKGRYRLFTLEERYSSAVLPQVALVDLKEEEKAGNFSSCSRKLQFEIEQNLKNGEQSILLINRRGYRSVVQCMECREVLECPNCDAPLTYHKANGRLMCHYCGYSQEAVSVCPSCGSGYLKYMGQGTQKIEDELKKLFPCARVLRMDTDSVGSRVGYERKFSQFAAGEYDIMVGTQMIAKGLDFPKVTLVGVINADQGLFSPDYRSPQRVFSLLCQVVGRSGRSNLPGRAIIQTYSPDNDVIRYAARQDYRAFYAYEIQFRRAMLYPPFCDICNIGFSGGQDVGTRESANRFVSLLYVKATDGMENAVTLRVLGVTEAPLHRLSGRFRYRVLIKCHCDHAFRTLLAQTAKEFLSARENKGIALSIDINGQL